MMVTITTELALTACFVNASTGPRSWISRCVGIHLVFHPIAHRLLRTIGLLTGHPYLIGLFTGHSDLIGILTGHSYSPQGLVRAASDALYCGAILFRGASSHSQHRSNIDVAQQLMSRSDSLQRPVRSHASTRV